MLTEYGLGAVLSKLEENPNPKYTLEQYSITPGIAAHILFLAKNDIKGKTVYDLGCGAGRLAIGAALLGAKTVFGVDLDKEVLRTADNNARFVEKVTGMPIRRNCRWLQMDIMKIATKADVVIQFPPFEAGSFFFEKALTLSNKVYSIHKSSEMMEKSVMEACREHGFMIHEMKKFDYTLKWKSGKTSGFEIMLVIAKKAR
ncbi:MAG TPA: 50S ribosomal protein L11 methyltransferase [archaeon]|nr:50S ribosomal protein L11 methyltransferase [archaeon]